MTNKKIKILDNLELATSEVEERIVKESIEYLKKSGDKFYKDAFSTPIKYLKSDLLDVAEFLSILIEKLDLDFFDENEMESFKDSNDVWKYKDIQINYIGDEKNKQFLLMFLLRFIESLDFTRIRLFENERTEDKDILKKYMEKEDKNILNEEKKENRRKVLEYKPD